MPTDGIDLGRELDPLPRRSALARAGRRVGAQRGEIDLVLGEQQAAGVALGEIEDIVDQRAEPGDAVEDRRRHIRPRPAAARRHSRSASISAKPPIEVSGVRSS